MAQELTTLVALAEDLVSVPSTHTETHNSNSRDSDILFGLFGRHCTQVGHKHMFRPIYIIFKLNLKLRMPTPYKSACHCTVVEY